MEKPFKKCPVCGGEVVEKKVEKLLRGGSNTAIVSVKAEVCQRCGERLYSLNIVEWFEQIRRKLEIGDIGSFDVVGKSCQVA